MSVPQTGEAIGGPDRAVIELRLIGYTADLEHLVLVEEGSNHERFRLVVEPDLFATLDEVRRRRREADLPVGDMAEFADRFGIDRETLEALLEEREVAAAVDAEAGDRSGPPERAERAGQAGQVGTAERTEQQEASGPAGQGGRAERDGVSAGTAGEPTDEPFSPPAEAGPERTGREESAREEESGEEPTPPGTQVPGPEEDDGESVVRVLDQEEAARRRREARRDAERAEEHEADEPTEETEPLFEQRAWGAWSVPVRESRGSGLGPGAPEETDREDTEQDTEQDTGEDVGGEPVRVDDGGRAETQARTGLGEGEPRAPVPADGPDGSGEAGGGPRAEADEEPGEDRPGEAPEEVEGPEIEVPEVEVPEVEVPVVEVPAEDVAVAGGPDEGAPGQDVGVGQVSSRRGGGPPDEGEADGESETPAPSGRSRPPRSSTPVSRLTPAQIQARLRAGHGVEEVAEEAGTERSWIERWLVPIEAERSRILNEARSRRLEHSDLGMSDAPLGEAVTENLGHIDVDPSSITWEVARRSKGSWRVIVRYVQGERERQATWLYDPGEHTLNPASPEAREVGFTRHTGEG